MPQAKRARPSFSPPRPGKSKASKDTSATNKSTDGPKERGRPSVRSTKKSNRKERTPSPGDSETEDSELLSAAEDHESMNDRSNTLPESDQEQSPEPDHILVEITNDPDPDTAISSPLLHRTMQEHWKDKIRTKISTDARMLMQVYIDTFVREAIIRSAYEKKEREGDDRQDSFLEVGDLERIAPQLVLDF